MSDTTTYDDTLERLEELKKIFQTKEDETNFTVKKGDESIIAPSTPEIKPYEPIKYIDDDPGEEVEIEEPTVSPIAPVTIEDPTTSSEDLYATKYDYLFGIDEINFEEADISNTACYISDEIEIGFLNDGEYIQLMSDYFQGTNGSVEFYIIDKSIEKPILPVNDARVTNEKIFYKQKPRFTVDSSDCVIKLNGSIIDESITSAINMNSDALTIDYKPIEPYSIKPESNTIKVKAILRNYDDPDSDDSIAPYIKSINIKIFRGNAAWTQIT